MLKIMIGVDSLPYRGKKGEQTPHAGHNTNYDEFNSLLN